MSDKKDKEKDSGEKSADIKKPAEKSMPETAKIAELKKALDEKQVELDDYKDHLKRLQAEFENYYKRVENERKELFERASEKIIVKLLTVFDDFQRALSQFDVKDETHKGIEMIFRNLHKILDEQKVVPIDAKGCKFDPFRHEVVCAVESSLPEDTIIDEVQKGYAMNGRIIRYSKVTISKNKTRADGGK